MSSARSGSDWAFKACWTSRGVNPGLSLSSHVSNCFSRGVGVLGLGLGFKGGAAEEWRRMADKERRDKRCLLISTAIAIDFVSIYILSNRYVKYRGEKKCLDSSIPVIHFFFF